MPRAIHVPSDDSDSDGTTQRVFERNLQLKGVKSVGKAAAARKKKSGSDNATSPARSALSRQATEPAIPPGRPVRPTPGSSREQSEVIEISSDDDATTTVQASSQTTNWYSSQQTEQRSSSPDHDGVSVLEACQAEATPAPSAAEKKGKKRKSDAVDEDTPKKRRKGKSAEEKEAEKELKRQEKEVAREQREMEKKRAMAAKKAHRAANTQKTDKKAGRATMHIMISPGLQNDSQFQNVLQALPTLFDGKPTHWTYGAPLGADDTSPVVRWQRDIDAQYDLNEREWVVCEKHRRYERTVLLWVTVAQLTAMDLSAEVARLRTDKKDQVFVMIFGMKGIKGDARREQVESRLVEAQIAQKFLMILPEDATDAARWLLEMTGDLAVRPYKIIEMSYLSFCHEIVQTSGRAAEETYRGMLTQIPRVTNGMAKSISGQYPTLNALFEAYEAAGQGARNMLHGTEMGRTTDGRSTGRRIGVIGSQKIATVFTGMDPLAIVG